MTATLTTTPTVPGQGHPVPGPPAPTGARQGRLDAIPPDSPFTITRPGAAAPAGDHARYRAITDPDISAWLTHVRPAAGCTRPVRLTGEVLTLDTTTGQILFRAATETMPDGVIYKPCGNRRAAVCPACSHTYQQDAYHLIRTGLIGGKSIPTSVGQHPAVFATFTAPSFGPVHTRHIPRHTCTHRRSCGCRPQPCHARREAPTCPHGQPMACYARHDPGDAALGRPLCPDCYDYDHQVVFNHHAGELWRRTTIAITRHLRRTAVTLGLDPNRIRLAYGKTAELQRRGVVHFHAIIRLDGIDPTDPARITPPPPGLGVLDLVDAVERATPRTRLRTPAHPDQPAGWPLHWGDQLDIRPIHLDGNGTVSDSMVAGYLAKYATKSTETTGHLSGRLTAETIDLYADPEGSHTERLIDACWRLGRPRPHPDPTASPEPEEPGENPWVGLRRWAHMLGFGGHFLTKSRRYSLTFRILRHHRVVYQQQAAPPPTGDADEPTTTLVVNFLTFAGAGWHTSGDALLANTSAALARERRQVAREETTNPH